MKRLVLAIAFLVSAYVFVWGVTWLVGDRGSAVRVATDVGSFSSYPGVFLGGLPPTPFGDLNTPFYGAVLGAFMMVVSGVLLLRTRSGDPA